MRRIHLNVDLCLSEDTFKILEEQGLVFEGEVSRDFAFYLAELLAKESFCKTIFSNCAASEKVKSPSAAKPSATVLAGERVTNTETIKPVKASQSDSAAAAQAESDEPPDKQTESQAPVKPVLAKPSIVADTLSKLLEK